MARSRYCQEYRCTILTGPGMSGHHYMQVNQEVTHPQCLKKRRSTQLCMCQTYTRIHAQSYTEVPRGDSSTVVPVGAQPQHDPAHKPCSEQGPRPYHTDTVSMEWDI